LGTHFINENCIACGACEPICPVAAISSGDPMYVIDMDVCIECGACDDICPVDAIAWENK
jgi:ferredoxin